MGRSVIREAAVYMLLLVIFALLMHPDLLNGTERFSQMAERGNYLHPLLYTGLIYLIILIFRGIGSVLLRLLRHTKNAH